MATAANEVFAQRFSPVIAAVLELDTALAERNALANCKRKHLSDAYLDVEAAIRALKRTDDLVMHRELEGFAVMLSGARNQQVFFEQLANERIATARCGMHEAGIFRVWNLEDHEIPEAEQTDEVIKAVLRITAWLEGEQE